MRPLVSSALAGVVFGAGLVVSGMTNANKVIGFLDLADGWDPSLALVMVGAITVHAVLFRLILKRPNPFFASAFGVPSRTDLTPRLVLGSGMFGVGWALGGYCPGPGLVSVASGAPHALVFFVMLVAGMMAFTAVDRWWSAQKIRQALLVEQRASEA